MPWFPPGERRDFFLDILFHRMREVQISQFAAAESAAQQHGEDRTVPFSSERVWGRRLPEATSLLGREPVPKPHAQLLGTFHASDTGGEFRTEQAGVCGLIGESSYCSKSSIDPRTAASRPLIVPAASCRFSRKMR